MAIIKKIKDWEKILVDTTALIALFRSQDLDNVDERTQFVVKLFSYLSKHKTPAGKERTFYVSTLTVAELLTKEQDTEKIKRILKVLNSRNVEFIDFDLTTALEFNRHLSPYLTRESLHEVAEAVGFKTNDFMMAREWIVRDYMIIMSGLSRSVDVILTADKRTFYPLCQKLNANCVLLFPELFEQSENYILNYRDDKVEDFLRTDKGEKKKKGKVVSVNPNAPQTTSEL